jgi:hypothetical protein
MPALSTLGSKNVVTAASRGWRESNQWEIWSAKRFPLGESDDFEVARQVVHVGNFHLAAQEQLDHIVREREQLGGHIATTLMRHARCQGP